MLFKAAGLMVPEPSTRSPPIPFIEAESGVEEPYIIGQGKDGKVEGRRKADGASTSMPRSQNAGWKTRDWIGPKRKRREGCCNEASNRK